MGIPSYFSYLVKNYPHILSKFVAKTRPIDNLYLDYNSILYDVYHKLVKERANDIAAVSVAAAIKATVGDAAVKEAAEANDLPKQIIQRTIQKIHEYIHLVAPQKTVYIAFDGVAPVAKIEQQRSRRYKSWYQSEVMKYIYMDAKNNNTDNNWSTLAITPGTQFMSNLDAQLNAAFPSNVKNTIPSQSQKASNTHRIIIVSGSGDPGEGEHKLFEYIRQNPEKHQAETTIIYGLDADLIVLSICHLKYAPNIFLFRESPQFQMENLEPNANYLLDIQHLARVIDINTNDYIVLTFMLGNDFLPHFPALNIRTGGMDKLLIAYRQLFLNRNHSCDNKSNNESNNDAIAYLTLTTTNTIHWTNMYRLVAVLADKEDEYIQEEHKLRNRREFYLPEKTADEQFKKFEATPTFERSLEKYIFPHHQDWQLRYYAGLFPDQYKSKTSNQTQNGFIQDVVHNYFEGLEWTLRYYTHGCPDWRWTYKYSYPPLLQDLRQTLVAKDNQIIVQFNSDSKPVSKLTQLCSVLPLAGLIYLPSKLQTKLTDNYSHWYRTDYCFLWAYCRYFWESHVVMEHIDIHVLETLVSEFGPN